LSEALGSGDQDAIESAYAQYDPSGLLNYKQALEKQDREETFKKWLVNQQQQNAIALENIKQKNALAKLNAVGSSGGFGKTTAGLALGIMSDPNATDEQKEWATLYLSKDNPESIYETAKQRRSGTLSANAEQAEQEKQAAYEQQTKEIDQLLADVEDYPELLDVYSPYKAAVARLSKGSAGFTKEQLEKRGDMIRQIGQIQNTILAEARASGQTGINTMAEIEQATKGLKENSSPDEIKGALKAVKRARSKYIPNTYGDDDPLGVR
jgi:hypothetical protein